MCLKKRNGAWNQNCLVTGSAGQESLGASWAAEQGVGVLSAHSSVLLLWVLRIQQPSSLSQLFALERSRSCWSQSPLGAAPSKTLFIYLF